MRQLLIQVPRGRGGHVTQAARALGASNVAHIEATGDLGEGQASHDEPAEAEGPVDLVIAHVSNGSVAPLLEQLDGVAGLRVSFFPKGALALRPPADEAPEQVKDVEERSPVEVVLAGAQSVGAWSGLLGYAVGAGAIVWVGLFTNTIYLLTAAMLVAPFAGPAMNAALATASGDSRLLWQSLLRYAGAIAATVLTAAALSFVLGQETATSQMVARGTVSEVAVLLPLVAGAVGALSLMQSDRDSLVSGAAVGVLVAASLAPPAGVVGMGAVLGRWDLAGNAAFVLALQLVGINVTGALVFRFYGLAGRGVRYTTRWKRLFAVGLSVSAALLAVLLVVQFSGPVRLERASLAQRAANVARQAIERHPGATPIEVNARFPRSGPPEQRTLLVEAYAQRRHTELGTSQEYFRQSIANRIEVRLHERFPDVTPLVQVTVLRARVQ